MTIGERIEERRKAIGIKSQSELARRAEMRQSTLNGLIRNPYRWSPYLVAIARALDTSVEYLTGESDDPNEGAPLGLSLSPEQRALLDQFDVLPPADRAALLQVARTMASRRSSSGAVHAPTRSSEAASPSEG